MKKLVELCEETSRLPIAEQSRYIRARLPEVVSEQHLKFWRLGDPISRASRRVLVGIATWSRYDLELIDAIADSRQQSGPPDEEIDIFDFDEPFENPSAPKRDYESYVPGIGKVFNPPVVGIWETGNLVIGISGTKAREALIKRYNLNLPPLGRDPKTL